MNVQRNLFVQFVSSPSKKTILSEINQSIKNNNNVGTNTLSVDYADSTNAETLKMSS